MFNIFPPIFVSVANGKCEGSISISSKVKHSSCVVIASALRQVPCFVLGSEMMLWLSLLHDIFSFLWGKILRYRNIDCGWYLVIILNSSHVRQSTLVCMTKHCYHTKVRLRTIKHASCWWLTISFPYFATVCGIHWTTDFYIGVRLSHILEGECLKETCPGAYLDQAEMKWWRMEEIQKNSLTVCVWVIKLRY